MPKNLCWIVSNLDYSKQFDQLAQYLHGNGRYRLSYILLADREPILYESFRRQGIDAHFIRYRGKADAPGALIGLFRILRRMRPDIVHAHLLEAAFLGLVAARLAGIESRIHTRHHASENHLFYPKRAVLYDKVISGLSTKIVAVSDIVSDVMVRLEGVPPSKISVIPHGYLLEEMVANPAVVAEVRADYGLGDNYPVVGVVGRFVEWKGIQYIIPAFKKLLAEFPRARLVMANARGNFSEQLRRQLRDELDEKQYIIINIERRIFELFKNFDVFVHVPVSSDVEAYGQVYIESLLLKVPSVFTLSGIANSFVVNGRNALVVPYKDSQAICQAVKTILGDRDLRERITRQGYADVRSRYHIADMCSKLDELYCGPEEA